MTDLIATSQPQELTIEAVVLRCTCGHPETHVGEVCPQAQREDRGRVAYWNRNPLRRWFWRLGQLTRQGD